MKIGMLALTDVGLDSRKTIDAATHRGLEGQHALVFRSGELVHVSPARKRELNAAFLRSVDVLFGEIDDHLLQVRQQEGLAVPWVLPLNGRTARGLHDLARMWPMMTTGDVLLGNCQGDLAILHKFFGNATIRALPWGVDCATFTAPEASDAAALRAELGIGAADKVLLYAGRVGVEKNIYTLLRLYAALEDSVEHVHLVIAGDVIHTPGNEVAQFGVYAMDPHRLVQRTIDRLGIDRRRLHVLGHQTPERLRTLYAASDVLVNLTLNHDENFGMAQVEAMACGLPVVGTRWGGLMDTIAHAVTGYQVTTAVTLCGVKANWLEALVQIRTLLDVADRPALRHACRAHVETRFPIRNYQDTLAAILVEAAGNGHGDGRPAPEPLRVTPFAVE